MLILFTLLGCYRATDPYDVRVYGQGVVLDEIAPEPEPMGGQIEYARFRLWGSNLGFGLVGFGDQPRADGAAFTIGSAGFGYPRDPAFDANAAFVSPGPPVAAGEDACFSRVDATGYAGISEYVDVGDAVSLGGIRLERDPSAHVRPGESWYVGYGNALGPVVRGHASLPDTWAPGATWPVAFPGAIPHEHATIGAVPFPAAGELRLPEDIRDLEIAGQRVRAPKHTDDADDDVRFPGPWTSPVELTWTPSERGEPLTVTIRYLASGVEGACSDACADCGPGFHCEEGYCVPDEGSGWNVLGELSCTVEDDGAFTLTPELLGTLDAYYPWDLPADERWQTGAVLVVSRIAQGTLEVPDAYTFNERRVPITPVRVRATDAIVTRLETP